MATYANEKGLYDEQIDRVETKGSDTSAHDAAVVAEFDEAEQKRIVRRIDFRLVTLVGLMYCVSLMDRTNLSNAAIAGMTVELKMVTGYGYSIVTLVFFITYVVFQPPATIAVKFFGPRVFLPTITLLWGSCMIGMGFVKTWHTLAGLRVLLGVLEAGFFPGCVYLLSTWYTRYEIGKRYSCFYILGCVASACAGILAFGLMQMKGLAKLQGWSWIFIMEGIITCLLAFIGYWLLVDFPDGKHGEWNFLPANEKRFIMAKVNRDRGDAKTTPFSWNVYLRCALDAKIWGFALIFCCTTTITYALAYFLPIILRENMGFSIGASQCLTAPPYVFAGFVMFATGYVGDKYKMRGPIIIFNMVLALIGLPIMGFHSNPGVRYFGVFLVTAGANSNVPATMSYQANNIRGQWKRAFCSATLVGFGGIGGIAGGLIFRTQDKPTYHPGMYGCITAALLIIVTVCLLSTKFYFDNKKADRGELEIEESAEDHQHGFRYTI